MNYNDASIVITPNGTKAGKLYAVKPTDGSGDLTVTRATSATRVNASGVIETVGANVPRLDYSNGTCPSILVEPQRTNVLLNSETLATQSVTVTAQAYTLSFYGNGTVALSGTHTASVVGLGTTRKTYTFTPTAGTLTLTITGACTKGQLEAGSYATSYIPTTTASVTRNDDFLTRAGFGNTSASGTLFFDLYANNIFSTSGEYILQLFNGSIITDSFFSTANSLSIIANGTAIQIFNNGFTQNIQNITPTKGQRIKIAIRYNGTNISSAINGTTSSVFTDTSVGVKNALRINNGQFSSHSFNSVVFIPDYLTDTQLAQLTTI